MTNMHPIERNSDKKCRSEKQGEPVDPEELSRRLTAHLAEQNSKATKRWDTIFKKTATARGFEDIRSSSCISTDTVSSKKANATATIKRRKTHGIIHKLSGPLSKYQRHYEINTCKSRRNVDNLLSIDISQYGKRPDVRFQQTSCEYENHSSIEVHEEDLRRKILHPVQRIFHIQTMLRRKSSQRTATKQMSNESQGTAQNSTKNSIKARHLHGKRFIRSSQGKEELKVKERSISPATKQISSSNSKSQRTSTDPCSNKLLSANLKSAASSRPARQGLRKNIIALLRRDPNF